MSRTQSTYVSVATVTTLGCNTSYRRRSGGRRRAELLPSDRDRPAAGRHRTVPDLESRSLGADPGMVGLGSPRHRSVRERVVLSRVRRRVARRDRDRIVRLLPRRLVPDHPRFLPHAADPSSRNARRADGVAADRRDHSRRAHRSRARTRPADAVRQAARRRDLPHRQRRDPARSANEYADGPRSAT